MDWNIERVMDTFPRLSERLNHRGSQLSGGEQQMLSIGRALMTNPRLLILDEATEGLAPFFREEIWRIIRTVKNDGIATIIVDKNLERSPRPRRPQRHTGQGPRRIQWRKRRAAKQARAPEEIYRRLTRSGVAPTDSRGFESFRARLFAGTRPFAPSISRRRAPSQGRAKSTLRTSRCPDHRSGMR